MLDIYRYSRGSVVAAKGRATSSDCEKAVVGPTARALHSTRVDAAVPLGVAGEIHIGGSGCQ